MMLIMADKQQMWGGRFTKAPTEILEKFNASITFDKTLYEEDIAGSIAHATMLADSGVISEQDKADIIGGLQQIKQEISENRFSFKQQLEDIHMNIEARLIELIGDAGKKLHTARSRNDQVATDTKLWLKKRIVEIKALLQQICTACINQAQQHQQTVMPGFTHLQVAQPISFAFHMLAYHEMFSRDFMRMHDCLQRLDYCPLGSAALAGTSYKIDREQTAQQLGFKAPTNNALDSVSDRDFVIEFIAHASIIAMHLSRLAEEIILWCNPAFAFISLDDAYCTGSSIMPQKKNPDGAELIRGKTGRINGNLIAILTTMKSLPLAYSKDMQEDKEPLFDTVSTISGCLTIMIAMINTWQVNADNMRQAVLKGHATATDVADYLVQHHKVSFREAHHITGELVALADQHNCQLSELDINQVKQIDHRITAEVLAKLTIDASMNSRNSFGGVANCVPPQS
jgi:argininosuccinate lyase